MMRLILDPQVRNWKYFLSLHFVIVPASLRAHSDAVVTREKQYEERNVK